MSRVRSFVLSPRHQELSISQPTQVKHQGLALVHNLLGLQELLTFTEQSNAPGALLRAAGAGWDVVPSVSLPGKHRQLPTGQVTDRLRVSTLNHTSQGLSKHKGRLQAQ